MLIVSGVVAIFFFTRMRKLLVRGKQGHWLCCILAIERPFVSTDKQISSIVLPGQVGFWPVGGR